MRVTPRNLSFIAARGRTDLFDFPINMRSEALVPLDAVTIAAVIRLYRDFRASTNSVGRKTTLLVVATVPSALTIKAITPVQDVNYAPMRGVHHSATSLVSLADHGLIRPTGAVFQKREKVYSDDLQEGKDAILVIIRNPVTGSPNGSPSKLTHSPHLFR